MTPDSVALPGRGARPALDLSHAVVLVTGASSGLGRAIAVGLAGLGAKVGLAARRADRLAETRTLAEEAAAASGHAAGETGVALELPGDVRDPSDLDRWVRSIGETFGKLTGLVNNAGVIGGGSALEVTDEEWDRQFDLNVKAVMRLTRLAAPMLIEAQRASEGRDASAIVNISSVTGTRPYAGLLPYCATKAAVRMMTACSSLDFAPHGVRVNALEPGVVRSELHTVGGAVADYDAFLARSKETHPIGRHGEPEDVAWATAFLLSREASWITGASLPIDGGRANTSLR